MAALKLKISPLPVPNSVEVNLPSGETVTVSIEDIDEETLSELLEEFSASLIKLAGK